jgi:hypothetical protein
MNFHHYAEKALSMTTAFNSQAFYAKNVGDGI